MPANEFLEQAKGELIHVPGIRWVNNIRLQIIQIRELTNLLGEKKMVVFHPFARMEKDAVFIQEMIREFITEWIDIYGTIRLRRTTEIAIGSPAGAIMLYSPLALLRIPSTHEEYIKGVRHETRKVINQAYKHGYVFNEFIWNDHLDEIYEINTSKEIRQSEPMRGWYREPVQPRYQTKEESQYKKYYGAFKEGKLCAYYHLWLCGDFALSKHIIGHAKHLQYGIMNGLISYAIRECIRYPQLQWLKYGAYQKGSLCSFKKHAGFQGYAVLVDLEGDQEITKYRDLNIQTIWHL